MRALHKRSTDEALKWKSKCQNAIQIVGLVIIYIIISGTRPCRQYMLMLLLSVPSLSITH